MLHVAAMFRRTFGASRYTVCSKWTPWHSCQLLFLKYSSCQLFCLQNGRHDPAVFCFSSSQYGRHFPAARFFWTKNRRHDPAVSCCVSKNVSDVAADSCCMSKNVLNVAAVSCCVLKNVLLVAAVSCGLQYGGGHVENFLVMQLLCTV